jgi:hypothetical protein
MTDLVLKVTMTLEYFKKILEAYLIFCLFACQKSQVCPFHLRVIVSSGSF